MDDHFAVRVTRLLRRRPDGGGVTGVPRRCNSSRRSPSRSARSCSRCGCSGVRDRRARALLRRCACCSASRPDRARRIALRAGAAIACWWSRSPRAARGCSPSWHDDERDARADRDRAAHGRWHRVRDRAARRPRARGAPAVRSRPLAAARARAGGAGSRTGRRLRRTAAATDGSGQTRPRPRPPASPRRPRRQAELAAACRARRARS